MAITSDQAQVVGTDLGGPAQNRVPYQRDPFEGAQVTEGTGRTYTANLGFGTKPYQFDPFDQSAA